MPNMHGKSVANWDPAIPKGSNKEKLMNPTASEQKDFVTADNPQKRWEGKSGKPSGPFGPQGKDF